MTTFPNVRTWTTHTFRCTRCGHLCYARQEAIDEARRDIYGEPVKIGRPIQRPFDQNDDLVGTVPGIGGGGWIEDAEIAAGFDFCLACVDGVQLPGERAEFAPGDQVDVCWNPRGANRWGMSHVLDGVVVRVTPRRVVVDVRHVQRDGRVRRHTLAPGSLCHKPSPGRMATAGG